MKYHGQIIERTTEVIVIPIGGKEIVFHAKPVTNFKDFETKWKKPEPPIAQYPDRPAESDYTDATYIKLIDEWVTDRFYWMQLESLSATEGLEFETVDRSDPKTFKNFIDELEKTLGMSWTMRVLDIIRTALGLNQDKIDEATQRFLHNRAVAQEKDYSRLTAPSTTPSGEPAKDSA